MFFLPIIPIYTKKPEKLNEIIKNKYVGSNNGDFYLSVYNKFNNIIIGSSVNYTHYLIGTTFGAENNKLSFTVKEPITEKFITIKPLFIYEVPLLGKKTEQLISKIFNLGKKYKPISLAAYFIAFAIYCIWLVSFTIYGITLSTIQK